jgi:hypothetical protein
MLGPCDFRRRGVAAEADARPTHEQALRIRGRHVMLKTAVHGVEFEQMRGRRAAALRLVDMNERELGPSPRGA